MLIVRIGARKRKRKLYIFSDIWGVRIHVWRTRIRQEFREYLFKNGFNENTRKRTSQEEEEVVQV